MLLILSNQAIMKLHCFFPVVSCVDVSVSLRSHEGPYVGSELSCLDRRVLEFSQRPCCHCRHGSGQTCGEFHTPFRSLTNTLLNCWSVTRSCVFSLDESKHVINLPVIICQMSI